MSEERPQISLASMFVATALFAVAAGALVALKTGRNPYAVADHFLIGLAFGCPIAAVGVLVKRPWLGVVVGAIWGTVSTVIVNR